MLRIITYDRLTLKYGFSISSTTITFNLISDSSSNGMFNQGSLDGHTDDSELSLKSFPENELIVDEHVESDAPKTALR